MTRYLCAVVLLLCLGCASGCGQSLKTEEDVGIFLRDVADGKGDGHWALADHPSPAAALAWQHRSSTTDLGDKLHEHGKEWACNAAKAVEIAPKLSNGIYQPTIDATERSTIVANATAAGAPEDEVDELIDDFLSATAEAAEIASKACDSLEHLEG
jgi:hypothetical protein